MINLIDFNDKVTQEYVEALERRGLNFRLIQDLNFLDQVKKEFLEGINKI